MVLGGFLDWTAGFLKAFVRCYALIGEMDGFLSGEFCEVSGMWRTVFTNWIDVGILLIVIVIYTNS